MSRSLRKSLIIVLFYFTISMRYAKLHAKDHEALIFTRDVPRMVYDVVKFEKYGYPKVSSPTAIACPIESSEEQAFNDQHALGKNSLFVRDTYERAQNSRDIDFKICDTPYKMSIVYHTIAVEFQFGFEIYYDKSKFGDKNFVDSKKWHYDLITNTHSKKNYIKPILSRVPSMPPALGNRIPTSVTSAVSRILQDPKMNLDDQTELGFVWSTAFHMKFNFRSKRLAQAVYNLSQATRGVFECDDWNLGIEYFTGVKIPIEDLYSEENQAKMLKDVKIPTWKPPQDDNEDLENAACEFENQCFAKWSAVPAEQFHFLAAQPISCSYLLAVPIWKSTIEDVLKKLDNFLYTVSQILSHPIGVMGIHSGVHGDLRLPTNSNTEQSLKRITLADNDIPVPDIIYKLIKYKPTICKEENNETAKPKDDAKNNELKEDNEKDKRKDELNKDNENGLKKDSENDQSKRYDEKDELLKHSKVEDAKKLSCQSIQTAMIVVVHNNPNFNPDTDKICRDMCFKWGWEEIQIREVAGRRFKSKYIYCCEAKNVNVRKKLGINNDEFSDKSLEFSLKSAFVPDFDTMGLTTYDISHLAVKDYRKLFEGGELKSNENNEEELAIVKIDTTRAEYFKIQEPEHGEDEPEKSETELVDDGEALKDPPQENQTK